MKINESCDSSSKHSLNGINKAIFHLLVELTHVILWPVLKIEALHLLYCRRWKIPVNSRA